MPGLTLPPALRGACSPMIRLILIALVLLGGF